MINRDVFYGKPSHRICSQPELIENFAEAVADKENIWENHHKLEAFFTKQELIDMGRYYNVPPRELIFLKRSEHYKWPHKGRKNGSEKNRTIQVSEETKQKQREKHKCKKVQCIETGITYDSIHAASDATGISRRQLVRACNGENLTAYGMHWDFLE